MTSPIRRRWLAVGSALTAIFALLAACTAPPAEMDAQRDLAAIVSSAPPAVSSATMPTSDSPALDSPTAESPSATTQTPASTTAHETPTAPTSTEQPPPEEPQWQELPPATTLWNDSPDKLAEELTQLLTSVDPQALGQTVILVENTDDDQGENSQTIEQLMPALSLASEAGTEFIAVANPDPRAESAVVSALAAMAPEHVIGVGPGFGVGKKAAQRLADRVAVAQTGVELPGGGQLMFPDRTLVALYGNPVTKALGVLGAQSLPKSIKRAKKLAKKYEPYAAGHVIPSFEIIATIAAASKGSDGKYSSRMTVDALRPWVDDATAAGMYVILDLQPGRARLLSQAKAYAELLENPSVGLALDPEWKLAKGQKPLQQIGGVDAAEVNEVIEWLSDFVSARSLPQKVLVLHQFKLSMLRDSANIVTDDDNVAVLIHMDGQGSTGGKELTWKTIVGAAPKGVWWGWKNFYEKDKPTMTPKQTMKRDPVPVMISYQ